MGKGQQSNGWRRAARGAVGVGVAGLLAVGCGKGKNAENAASSGSGDTGWAMYNRTYDGQRYADLDQINTGNVANLKPVCEIRLGEEGAFESGPIVVGDTMYVTTPHSTVALNAANCAQIWRDVDQPRAKDIFPVNRGVAYLDGKVFRGTPDGRLRALDASSGKVLWDVQVGNPDSGEFISSAPIAWQNMVFVGVAGSDWGIRGHMMAFDAGSGKELWRFYTVPMGNEPGADSWKIPSTAARGGGAQWTSYALDPGSGELFVPVANPAPDYMPHTRPGDNLYTNSLVVLDAKTGKLEWYYQLVPNDGFDWDLAAAPMLYSGSGDRVALGSKDGYAYAVDRSTHKPVWQTPITTIQKPDTTPTTKGVVACPGTLGGVEWNGPAYDPKTKAIYVGSVDWCDLYTRAAKPEYKPGELYMGTSYTPAKGDTASGWLTAIDEDNGQVKWKFHAPAPIVAGVTPTAGGLVFTGDIDGNLYAFDANSGKVLMRDSTGGAIAGGVITYAVNGTQYVATTSGNASRTTFNTVGSPSIIIYSLNAPAGGPRRDSLPDVPTTIGGASPKTHQQQGVAHGAPKSKAGGH